jgi:Flp pilus assembly protein TadG
MQGRTGFARRRLAALAANDKANAALEFALVAPVLLVLLLNVSNFAMLIWAHMEVDFAAQMGAQAAFNACSSGTLPATSNCTNLSSVVSTAIQATSLGSAVTLASGYPSETCYSVSGQAPYTLASGGSPPSSGCPTTAPADYIKVSVTYSYTPFFSVGTLASPQTLTGTAMERLG